MNLEQYRRWNIAVGGSIIFSLVVISTAVYFLRLPCPQLLKYDTPCILCGCTRDFLLIIQYKTACHNQLSELLFAALAGEIFFRIAVSFLAKQNRMKLFITLEIIFHIIISAAIIFNL